MVYTKHYISPLGGILLSADEVGLTGLWFDGEKYYAENLPEEHIEADTPILSEAVRWLDIYFDGREPDFTPPLHTIGSEFRQEVWRILLDPIRSDNHIWRYREKDRGKERASENVRSGGRRGCRAQ